jgi:hypothetical protein
LRIHLVELPILDGKLFDQLDDFGRHGRVGASIQSLTKCLLERLGVDACAL